MQEIYRYQIEVQGQVDESDFNATSPLQVKAEMMEDTTTLLALQADQSGLVGMIRYLHHQGFMLLSVSRDQN